MKCVQTMYNEIKEIFDNHIGSIFHYEKNPPIYEFLPFKEAEDVVIRINRIQEPHLGAIQAVVDKMDSYGDGVAISINALGKDEMEIRLDIF